MKYSGYAKTYNIIVISQ